MVGVPRERSPNRDKAYEIFKIHNGNIENRRIAEMLKISEKTISGWKCKDKWNDKLNGVLQTNKWSTPKNKGGQPGNKNATGPPRNKHAEKYGFFSKWLPEETREIMGEIKESSPLDLLWDNIQLQYIGIIRAQKLMYVKNQEDKTKEITVDGVESTVYQVQQAWDKHGNFLSAQSRAMKTLESMIKQYDEMLHKKWELATEEQQARINKLKAEISRLNGNDEEIEDLDELDGIIYGDS